MANKDNIDKYLDKIIEIPGKENSDEKNDKKDSDRFKDAFDFANSCRDKEIDRFWTRGAYFWAFIAASFGAYMALFSASLKDGEISLENIINMSFISKTALAVLSFICFVFCFSWMLVHKGSKFWQRNWEKHVSYLGPKHIGKIYTTWLDKDMNDCEKNPISSKAYDYSVSKISYLCSLLLTGCSFLLFVFNAAIMIPPLLPFVEGETIKEVLKIIIPIALFLLIGIFIFKYFKECFGNAGEKRKKKSKNNKQKQDKVVFHSDVIHDVELV